MTHPALLSLLAFPIASPAPAQEAVAAPVIAPVVAQQQGAAPGESQEASAPMRLVTMGMSDMRTWAHHPKDAALMNALTLLDDRLAEIPEEIGDQMDPAMAPAMTPDGIAIWMRLLTAQKRVAMSAVPGAYQTGDMPFLFSVGVDEANEEAAGQYEAALKGLLTEMQAPFPLEMIERKGQTLEVSMGDELSPMGATAAAAILGTTTPSFEMNMNVGGYMDFLKQMMMEAGAPPESQAAFDIFSRMGLDEAQVEVASTCDGTTTQTASVMTELGGRMSAAGILPETGLSAGHLAPIPADATWASVNRLSLEAGFEALNDIGSEMMAEQGGGTGDLADMVKGATGIDLRSGLFGALGDTYGMYASETTGGGGLTSTVAFFSLKDTDAMLETKEQIENILNGVLGAEARGYVSVRSWMNGDTEYSTLMFPGLPIPLELTMAFGDEWLVVAATPQAAMGAMQHILTGGPSLASNPAIAEIVADGSKHAVSFMDAGYFARSGYGLTAMALSAVSNGVRSRSDATREPGPLMPTYPVFKEGIQNIVGYTELRGNDLVTMQTSDGSMVVQAAVMMGFLAEYGLPLMAPLMVIGAAPQIARNF